MHVRISRAVWQDDLVSAGLSTARPPTFRLLLLVFVLFLRCFSFVVHLLPHEARSKRFPPHCAPHKRGLYGFHWIFT